MSKNKIVCGLFVDICQSKPDSAELESYVKPVFGKKILLFFSYKLTLIVELKLVDSNSQIKDHDK